MIIGLTGGIASGKSTVSCVFEQNGCEIIDADDISRKLTQKGQPGALAIEREFGKEFFVCGELDRRKLAEHVFSSKENTQKLNSILHPLIREKILNKIKSSTKDIIILDVPLLFESGLDKICDKTICVVCGEENQILRAKQRSNYSSSDIKNRMNNQLSDEIRCEKSDYIIDSSAQKEKTADYALKILTELKNEKTS